MHFPFISKYFPPNGTNLLPIGPTILPNAPSFSRSYDEQTPDLTNLTIGPFIYTLVNNNSMKACPFLTCNVTRPSQDQQSSVDPVPMAQPTFCCSTREHKVVLHISLSSYVSFTNQSSPRYSYPLNSILAYSHLSPSHHHYLMCLSFKSEPVSY